MINCLVSFNPDFGLSEIISLLTMVGAGILFVFFDKKLKTQEKSLNDQQNVLNDLEIKEKNRKNQAILTLSLVNAGLYKYDLIIDNTGDSAASDVIISSDKDLLKAPDNKTLVLPIPIEPHQVLKIQTIDTYGNDLDFNVQWDDRSKQENSKDLCLKTDKSSLSIYENRLISLFQHIPGQEKELSFSEINKELEARDKVAERIKKTYKQMGKEISDEELEDMLDSL